MISYTPTESARIFHESPAKIKGLWGPVGSGKSSAALWEYILMCMESPIPLLGVAVRASYRELLDTTKMTFEYWFGNISEWHAKDEEFHIALPHPINGKIQTHILRFRSIQRPEETMKLQSMEPSFIFLEECVPAFSTTGIMGSGLPLKVFEVAAMRLRQAGAPYYRLVCTANPPSPSHWFYDKFIQPTSDFMAQQGIMSVFQPAFENKANLPTNYYEDLGKVLDPDMYRRFVEGEIIQFYDGERVFPEARDHYHIVDKELKADKSGTLVLGFDFGLTPATIITQINASGQWLWLREVQSFNSSFDSHLDILKGVMKEWYPDNQFRCWGDPAGVTKSQTDAKTCYEMGHSQGFEIKAGQIDWQSRKEAIKQRLQRLSSDSQPAVLISRTNCPIAAEAILGGYRYPKHSDGTIGVRPIKNAFSHIMDAAQYIATREFTIKSDRPWGEQPVVFKKPGYPVPDPFRSNQPEAKGRGSWLVR